MTTRRFKLKAQVSSSSPSRIRPVLVDAIRGGSIKKENDEFVIEAELRGESSKALNRALLSALRRVEKRTRLRSEWTSEDRVTERYFDYVLKKTIKN